MKKLLRYALLPFPAAYVCARVVEAVTLLGSSAGRDGIREPGEEIGDLLLIVLVVLAQLLIGFASVYVVDRRQMRPLSVAAIGSLVGGGLSISVLSPLLAGAPLAGILLVSFSVALGYTLVSLTRPLSVKSA